MDYDIHRCPTSNYRCSVIDFGPTIRHELAYLAYANGDVQLFTVPGVIQEVREAAARQQLSNLSIAAKD